jgi:hypothetical protein
MNFTSDDLKNLVTYIRKVSKEALSKEPPDEEKNQTLMTFVRQIEAIRFNPLLFKTLLNNFKVDYTLMKEPLNRLPLHINDAGVLSKVLVEWRLSNAR